MCIFLINIYCNIYLHTHDLPSSATHLHFVDTLKQKRKNPKRKLSQSDFLLPYSRKTRRNEACKELSVSHVLKESDISEL